MGWVVFGEWRCLVMGERGEWFWRPLFMIRIACWPIFWQLISSALAILLVLLLISRLHSLDLLVCCQKISYSCCNCNWSLGGVLFCFVFDLFFMIWIYVMIRSKPPCMRKRFLMRSIVWFLSIETMMSLSRFIARWVSSQLNFPFDADCI